ncbi:unnamed protein product [Brassicogethes aeneus]|uniref:C2H2-type domain-containing protein n=1 Tax=Brassicogethes aeneus TaxID=1431903 RepID=A0A9P0ANX7_BRAAE|nr:unnamed protein product [Brassicogethes aeneus]
MVAKPKFQFSLTGGNLAQSQLSVDVHDGPSLHCILKNTVIIPTKKFLLECSGSFESISLRLQLQKSILIIGFHPLSSLSSSYKTVSGLWRSQIVSKSQCHNLWQASFHKCYVRPILLKLEVYDSEESIRFKWTCVVCGEICFSTKMLSMHELTHAGQLFSCTYCNKEFNELHAYKRHISNHIRKRKHKLYCKICDKYFSSPQYLKAHLNIHEGITFKCDVCNKDFSDRVYLKKHLRVHEHDYEADRDNCSFCGKNLMKSTLRHHIKTYHSGNVYECKFCKKRYFSDEYLKQHLKTHEKGYVGPLIQCPLCEKTYQSSRGFKRHNKIEHEGHRHTCDLCGKDVSSAASLKSHIRSHNNEKPFLCSECGKSFGTKTLLKVHTRTHTKEKPYSCEICGKSYSQRSPLLIHLKTAHSDDRPFKCTLCDKAKIKKEFLLCGRSSIKKYYRFTCIVCGKGCSNNIKLNNHERTHVGQLFRCIICDKNCNSILTFKRHMYRHKLLRKGPAKCDVCDKVFATAGSLNHHSKKHSGVKLKCPLCNKHFEINYLKQHLKNHADGNLKVKCERCGREMKQSSVKLHNKTYHSGVAYECHICKKKYHSDGYLKTHLKTHEEGYVQTPKECQQCGKFYACIQSLRHHQKIEHEGVKQVCHVCGKELTSVGSLKMHLRNHRKEKPFICPICGKGFVCNNLLKVHLRTHTKEKPHVCKICGKCYSQRSPLLIHLRTVHSDERPFKCSICDKAFVIQSLLNSHLKTHSKICKS